MPSPFIFVRTYYGGDENRNTVDADWIKATQYLIDYEESSMEGRPQRRWFDDQIKYVHIGDPDPVSMPPWLLHTLGSISYRFDSKPYNEYQLDYDEMATIFVFDKIS